MRGTSDGSHAAATRWVTALSLLCITAWAMPALVMLDRGFAVQDEGTYVLSYRFWGSNPYFVSGAQYFYGPIFEALGESIPLLRLLRLAMVIGANAWFAWSFLGWLAQREPGLLPASRASLTFLLVAGGGMSYLWTPLTPGYYDLTADCALALVALMFHAFAPSPRPRAWVPWVAGIVTVALILTKWTAFPIVLLTQGSVLWSFAGSAHGARRRDAARYSVGFLVGVATAAILCQVLLVSIERFASTMWRVSSLTAVATHSFVYLARHNATSTGSLLLPTLVVAIPLIVGLVFARSAARRGNDVAGRRWLLATAVFTAAVLPFLFGWHGGGDHGRAVLGVVFAGLLVAGVAAVLSRSDPRPRRLDARLVVVVLVLVPVLQAAGTNITLLYVAAECFAMWMGVVLVLVVHSDCPPVLSTAVLVDLGLAVVAVAMICGTTTLVSPFKTTSMRRDSTLVPELGLRVDPVTARQYGALVAALSPYITPGSTPMITLDQKAGLTYILGGLPAGSTWTDIASPTRTAGILELACRNGDVPSGQTPVLLLDRPVDRHLARAMRLCGFEYPEDFRRLTVPGVPPHLSVYVPRMSS